MRRTRYTMGFAAVVLLLLLPAAAQADFGLVPGKTTVTASNEDGTIDLRAGSHPFALNVHFELNTNAEGKSDGGEMREVLVDLPPGLIGNPEAVPACPRQLFEGGVPECPVSTQIGTLRAVLGNFASEAFGAIYNLVPPPGVAAQLGFSSPVGLTVLQSATLRTDDYGVHVRAPHLPLEVTSVTASIWGTPADPAHTPERGGEKGTGIPSEAPQDAFLTLPTSCLGSPAVKISVNSKLEPENYSTALAPTLNKAGQEVSLQGCDVLPFSPTASAATSSSSADSPAGLQFGLQLPNQGLLDPDLRSETEPVKTVVTLPPGLIANPAAAAGLSACSEDQYESTTATSGPGLHCPEASKLGTLVANTPLLKEPIEGSVYLATPHANPFDSLIALYIVAAVPERGVLIKQAGEVVPDPQTGQLTTTFDHLPPVPYSSFTFRFREGPRAPLATPQTCGTYTATAKLYPFSDPSEATELSVPFTISSGANGSPCAANESQLPNAPSLSAGSAVPIAGSYSPFSTVVTRADGTQRIGSLDFKLPPGLTAKLAGVEQCTDAQIAAAAGRSAAGDGALELQSPSCPSGSQVGVVNVGAGVGPTPYFVQGKAYLAGPYNGAPVSLAIVTPAVAGPFDLGVVVVRAALYIDEATAEVTVRSDEVPRILQGLPLAVRSISAQVDRDHFTLNPTNCEPMSITGSVTSTLGQAAALSNPFRVGSCGALDFKPRLQIRFKGSSRRTSHPKVIATLTAAEGEANTRFAQVTLPKAAFLDQSHIGTSCTRVQFAAEACPPNSVYGRAEATTPLLDYPLKGTVYLRSNGGERELPDLVTAFKGPDHQPIKFTLVGFTDSYKGALRNTFQVAPDVPVSKFRLELFGGKRGLVELSDGLCRSPRATVKLKAHNGRESKTKPKVQASCGNR